MPTFELLTTLEPLTTALTISGYLDPGTGSYALQLLLAGLFGGMFVLKQSWQQFRGWFVPIVSGLRGNSTPVEGTK